MNKEELEYLYNRFVHALKTEFYFVSENQKHLPKKQFCWIDDNEVFIEFKKRSIKVTFQEELFHISSKDFVDITLDDMDRKISKQCECFE